MTQVLIANTGECISIVYTHIYGSQVFVRAQGKLMLECPKQKTVVASLRAVESYRVVERNIRRFATTVSLFCQRLGWYVLEGLIAKLKNYVCSKKE